MTELKKEFEFTLTTPIEFHAANGGSVHQGTFLTVKAPSNKQLKDVTKIRQALYKTLFDSEINKHKESDLKKENVIDDEETGSSGMLVMILSSINDANELYECFRRILLSGCCKINDEVIFTETLYEKMSEEDCANLLGRYVYNFFMLSVMRMSKKR